MLDREAIEHIQLIKDTANFVWGTQCRFGEVQVMEAPFSMFLLPLCLYDQFNIKLNYDRSILDISVQKDDSYVWLTNLTKLPIIEGFESLKPANLLHNFRVLDQFIRGNEFSEQKVD